MRNVDLGGRDARHPRRPCDRTLCADRRFPACPVGSGTSAEDHRQRADHARRLPDAAGLPDDRQFLALARYRLGHLFPCLPKQPGYNKRVRRLAPQIAQCITQLAAVSPSFGDGLRRLDSTPVPCGQSRETVRRSEFAGGCGYGYCASHSRHFWGIWLYLLCATDGMPIRFELFAADLGERDAARQLLAGSDLDGYLVLADKGRRRRVRVVHGLARRRLPPPRPKDERFGSLGALSQWIESVFWTCKGQLALERHGGRTVSGLWHNSQIGQPGRELAPCAR